MPRVKIDYVASFSSEDAENPASNLLANEVSRQKWLGNKGEASQSVVLQLAKSTKIQSVTVGSHHSALVEVFVGRSEKPLEPFKVLVLSSVFMSPSESKKSENVSKIRTFQYDQLAADVRDQSWDRVRVVCLQPYNKHVKYGLSFIHIFEPETAKNSVVASVAPSATTVPGISSAQKFTVTASSSDEEESFKPGELFAKMNKSPQLSVDAQIRKASKPSSLKDTTESSARLSRMQLPESKPKKTNLEVSDDQPKVSRNRDNLIYNDEEEPNDKIDKIIQRDRELKERSKEHTDGKIKDDYRQKDKENSRSSISNDSRGSDKRNHDASRHSRKDSDNHKDVTKPRRKDSHSHKDAPKNDSHSSHRRDSTPKNKDLDRSDKESRNNKDKDRNSRSDSDLKREQFKNGESSSRHANKRPHSTDKTNQRPVKRLKPGPRTSSPHRLMADVVFVLSGYQNPRRAALRDKALAMGAKYRQDWADGCTHLICAFANTPKLRQVRSRDDQTAIVTGEWIEECCKERRLLPWQWFATEPDYKVKRDFPDDEEEMMDVPADESECDTDDEIQKVLDQQNDTKQKSPDKPKLQNSPNIKSKADKNLNVSRDSDVGFVSDERFKGNVSISDSGTDEYTDEEKDEPVEVKIDSSKMLPDFFEGFTFAVDSDLENLGIDCGLLKNYITAYSGELVEHISEDSTVNYIISMNPACAMQRNVKSAVIVKPDWIWRCHKKLRKVSSKDFIVK